MKFKLLLKIFISIFLLIPILFVLLDIFNITNYINLTKNYDWLGFYGGFFGSTLGGLATFVGVYLTLEYNRKSDNDKNRLSMIPVLEYVVSSDEADFDNSRGQLAGEGFSHINIEGADYQDNESLEWHYNIIITNIGLGHAQISGMKFEIGDKSGRLIEEFNFQFPYATLVKKDDSKSIKFLFYAPNKRFEKNHISGKEFSYDLKITIQYKDLLENQYEQKLHSYLTKRSLPGEELSSWTSTALHYYEYFKHIK